MKLIAPIAVAVISAFCDAQSPSRLEFACNRLALTPAARKRHFDELSPALRAMNKRVRELPDGFEFEFPSDASAVLMVSEWAAAEHLCCPFFDIDLRWESKTGGFWMRLSGAEGVKTFIRAEFARWFKL